MAWLWMVLGGCTGDAGEPAPECSFSGEVEGAVQGGIELVGDSCSGTGLNDWVGGSVVDAEWSVQVLLEPGLILEAGQTFSAVDALLVVLDVESQDAWSSDQAAPCTADIEEITEYDAASSGSQPFVRGTIRCDDPITAYANNVAQGDLTLSGDASFVIGTLSD